MKDRRNLDDIRPDAIHDAVDAEDDLAERDVADLGHDPSRQGVRSRRDTAETIRDKEVGVGRSAGNIGADRFDILDGLGAQTTPSPEE